MMIVSENFVVNSTIKTNDIATSNVKDDSNVKKTSSDKNWVSSIVNSSNGSIWNKRNGNDKAVGLIKYDNA